MNPTQIDWTGAQWWWPQGLTPAPHQYADFALDLDLPGAPDQAWIALSSGTWYVLWVNGRWIEHGPTREVAPWHYYDVHDLAPLLRPGRNHLRIRAAHLGLATHWHAPCQAGLLVRGVVVADEREIDLGQRQAWRAAHDSSHLPNPPHRHQCSGWAEHVDLTRDPQLWLTTDADPAWQPPASIAVHPLPGRERLIPETAPRRCGRTRKAVLLHRHDTWQVWDFGQEVYGFMGVDLTAARAMTCDILEGSSLVDGLPDINFSSGDFRDRLELPAGRRHWDSYDKISARYVAFPAEIEIGNLEIREHHQPLVEVWRASPAAKALDPLDHAIITAAARTVTLYSDDLIADPRRERSQYNDPSVHMHTYRILYGTYEPIRRWLLQYQRGADADGVLRMCYPSPPGFHIIPDFSISFARNLHEYLDATGDTATALACFPSAVAGVLALERHADANGLLCNVPGWVFLCNSFELGKHPRSAALNALWADAWVHLGALCERFGDARAATFRSKGAQLRAAWRAAFWRGDRILDCDRSPDHQTVTWWNYHYNGHLGGFLDSGDRDEVFRLDLPWDGRAAPLQLAAHGLVRVLADQRLIFAAQHADAWSKPQPFEAWTTAIPAGTRNLRIEVGWNSIDWEVYLASDGPMPTTGTVSGRLGEERTAPLRPWRAPVWNQITAGYAIASGMLDPAEAVPLLRRCLRDTYHVPWLKRTTPIIATPCSDEHLIADRAVLCNTPQSLAFLCRALGAHGLTNQARLLCRRLYGAQVQAGSKTLWEEFAPRSSLCHAWAAQCVEWLLPLEHNDTSA